MVLRMDKRNVVSQTAMLIASLRALSCYEDDPRIRGEDYMAEMFLPDDKRIPLKTHELRPVIKKAIPEGLYEYVMARTKHFDELFLRFLNLPIPQIVLLGTGFDSRAYRFGDQINGSMIYEVDTPAMQEMKQRILKGNDVRIHNNIRYVSADLEKNEWFEALLRAGFQGSRQTLYIWEGVTFYLSVQSVETVLRLLKQQSASGSLLSFDYQHSDNENTLIDTGLENERIKFGLNAHNCDAYLHGFGYSVIEQIDSHQMDSRYSTMLDGKRFGNVKTIMHIVTARM